MRSVAGRGRPGAHTHTEGRFCLSQRDPRGRGWGLKKSTLWPAPWKRMELYCHFRQTNFRATEDLVTDDRKQSLEDDTAKHLPGLWAKEGFLTRVSSQGTAQHTRPSEMKGPRETWYVTSAKGQGSLSLEEAQNNLNSTLAVVQAEYSLQLRRLYNHHLTRLSGLFLSCSHRKQPVVPSGCVHCPSCHLWCQVCVLCPTRPSLRMDLWEL